MSFSCSMEQVKSQDRTNLLGAAAAERIMRDGLDPRVSSSGLFGHGVYLAENASKSDEYAEPSDGLCRMFLCRVVLGTPYVHTGDARTNVVPFLPDKQISLQSLRRPPFLNT